MNVVSQEKRPCNRLKKINDVFDIMLPAVSWTRMGLTATAVETATRVVRATLSSTTARSAAWCVIRTVENWGRCVECSSCAREARATRGQAWSRAWKTCEIHMSKVTKEATFECTMVAWIVTFESESNGARMVPKANRIEWNIDCLSNSFRRMISRFHSLIKRGPHSYS